MSVHYTSSSLATWCPQHWVTLEIDLHHMTEPEILSELTEAFRKSEYNYNWALYDPVTVPAMETTVVCLKENKPTCTNIACKFPGTCYVDMQIGLFAASYLADVIYVIIKVKALNVSRNPKSDRRIVNTNGTKMVPHCKEEDSSEHLCLLMCFEGQPGYTYEQFLYFYVVFASLFCFVSLSFSANYLDRVPFCYTMFVSLSSLSFLCRRLWIMSASRLAHTTASP